MDKPTPIVTATAARSQGPPLPDPKILKARGARLLSLDGGGVKGISSVVILDAIMERVKQLEIQTRSNTSTEPRRPVDYFDLAAGTSTGGLIALMLFRLKMDTKQCYDAYYELAHDIFARTFLGSKVLGNLLGSIGLALKAIFKGSEYASGPLEAAIKKTIEKYSSNDDPRKWHLVNQDSGMMFMCATLKDEGESILLRSYTWPEDATPITSKCQQKKDGSHAHIDPQRDGVRLVLNDIPIVNAARATSAAPVYLPEEQWHGMTFWDGGVLNNNPIEQLWNARFDLVDSHSPPPPVSCVLSLGCGFCEAVKPHFLMRIFSIAARFMESYMANTEAKTLDFQRLMQRMQGREDENKNIQYFRLNADCKTHKFDMADFRIMKKLEALTREYIQDNAQAREDIERCAQLLAKK